MVATSGTAVGSLVVGANVADTEIGVAGLDLAVVWVEVALMVLLVAMLLLGEVVRRRAAARGRG